jgi:hypothetical protein
MARAIGAARGGALVEHGADAAIGIAESARRTGASVARRRQASREARPVDARLAIVAGDAFAAVADGDAPGDAALRDGVARAPLVAGIDLTSPAEADEAGRAVGGGRAEFDAGLARVEARGVGGGKRRVVVAEALAHGASGDRDTEREDGDREPEGRATIAPVAHCRAEAGHRAARVAQLVRAQGSAIEKVLAW